MLGIDIQETPRLEPSGRPEKILPSPVPLMNGVFNGSGTEEACGPVVDCG